MTATILQGDCREVMRGLEPDSVDAVVTDPPYELGFMGKNWDKSGVAFHPETWALVLRVLKPGGHLLAFGGSRTYHRMACAIEDAGFEIRDQIMWLYGSGFPKSRDVGKAIDAEAGVEREVVLHRTLNNNRFAISGTGQEQERFRRFDGNASITAPATDAARQWQGWGTALKPAHEPIVLARKPLVGTVAANVLEHGTGALNVDATRITLNGIEKHKTSARPGLGKNGIYGVSTVESIEGKDLVRYDSKGRWPANLIHDGSDEVEEAFAAFGERKGAVSNGSKRGLGYGGGTPLPQAPGFGDTGTASRFFYCAKASKADRDDGLDGEANKHATVKPTTLMRYLCRLITPSCGTVLDPFAGSGSTGRGAVLEGFKFIGIELEQESAEIARLRIGAAEAKASEDQRIAETQQLALWNEP